MMVNNDCRSTHGERNYPIQKQGAGDNPEKHGKTNKPAAARSPGEILLFVEGHQQLLKRVTKIEAQPLQGIASTFTNDSECHLHYVQDSR